MRIRRTAAIAGGLALVITAGLLMVALNPVFAATPPWEPDPNSASPYGNVVLYDSAGNVLTGGSDLGHIADYAAATTARTPGAVFATLFFAAPDHNQPLTGLWFNDFASGSTNFPSASAPAPLTGSGGSGFQFPLVTL